MTCGILAVLCFLAIGGILNVHSKKVPLRYQNPIGGSAPYDVTLYTSKTKSFTEFEKMCGDQLPSFELPSSQSRNNDPQAFMNAIASYDEATAKDCFWTGAKQLGGNKFAWSGTDVAIPDTPGMLFCEFVDRSLPYLLICGADPTFNSGYNYCFMPVKDDSVDAYPVCKSNH